LNQEADITARDVAQARNAGADAVNKVLIVDVLQTMMNQHGQTKIDDMKPYVDEVNAELKRLGFNDLTLMQTQDGHITAHETNGGKSKDVDVSEDRVGAYKRFQAAGNQEFGAANMSASLADWRNADRQYRQAAEDYMKAWAKVPAWDNDEQQRRQNIMNVIDRAELTCRVQGGMMANPIRWNSTPSDN
jgi:hypothetical protein